MKVIDKKRPNSNYKRIFFKTIVECDGNYEISNLGHIRSNKTSIIKILKPLTNSNHLRIHLYDNKKTAHTFTISKLLEKYFPNDI